MDAVNLRQLQAGDARTLADAKAHTDAREAAVRTDMAAGDAATLVAAKTHADAGDAATLTTARAYTDTRASASVSTANAYTDARFTAWNDTFTQYQQAVDVRFAATDRRISQIGAMGSAMTQMSANAVPTQAGRGRMAIGVGTQGGQAALSIGYGKRLPGGASITLGASFANGENSAGAGFGFDL